MALTVAIVGDALLDVTLVPTEPIRPGGDVPATVRLGAGGQGANLAVRLARRGAAARLACGLGADVAGRLLREALDADGVVVLAVAVPATGAVAVLLGAGGERTMLSQRAPFVDGVDLEGVVVDADWLAVSGYALLEPGAVQFARRCATLPVRLAVLGCDLPASRVVDWRETLAAARPHLVVLNAREAADLGPDHGGGATPGAALADELGALVVVTAPGAVTAAGLGLRLVVDAPSGGPVPADTTGAGDAFAAALIVALGATWPPVEDQVRVALSAAVGVAREVVGVHGAQASVPGERVARA